MAYEIGRAAPPDHLQLFVYGRGNNYQMRRAENCSCRGVWPDA
jgi:hypothetical protein